MKLTKKQIMITVAILLVFAVLLFFLLKRKPVNSYDSTPVVTDPTKTTIDENKANMIVRNLLSAMDQRGTDEQSIIENLTGLNRYDLFWIIEKFGVKPYFDYGLDNRSSVQKALTIDLLHDMGNWDLIGWLKAELKGSSLDKVRDIFKNNDIPF